MSAVTDSRTSGSASGGQMRPKPTILAVLSPVKSAPAKLAPRRVKHCSLSWDGCGHYTPTGKHGGGRVVIWSDEGD